MAGTVTDEMLREQSNRIDTALDDIAAHIPGALTEAEERGRLAALDAVDYAVRVLDDAHLHDENTRLRPNGDCDTCDFGDDVLAAISALREKAVS